ncbi:ComEC/Rec2 family competence protein [Xylanimonas protaetiae]|uniref:ComEC/Rec2 family competence protein n=1 Tax=Xylanimonas protaetiae TaxID=2509457 RepID=A0A4P6F6V8_9MICO|nr:ComEC/Rec2 family competence protein [Xylanimonas protaetiae]QAY71502.1 ComEC/Rec2 family competence protein [Xylanimonas protaetiae]
MTDLRLVPAALAAWAAAWVLTRETAWAWPAVALAVGACLVAAATAALGEHRSRRPAGSERSAGRPARGAGAAHVALALACVAGVGLSVQVHAAGRSVVEALAAQRADVVLSGRVADDGRPGAFGSGETWVLAADTVRARAVTSTVRARVEVTSTDEAPPYGARVVVHTRLAPTDDGAAEAARASTGSTELVRAPPAVVAATTAMRSALLDVTADLSPQARGLVPGIAVGDTSRLPPDLAAAFRATGLTHLTAVSGGHFAIVLALVTALAGTVRAPRPVGVLVVAVVAAAFVLLVRPDPSVLRAAAMAAVMLLGVTWGRPALSVPSLAACAVVLLGVDPWLSRSFGFALSCAATAGLVLLAPPVVRRLTPWVGRTAAFALAVPFAAQAACGPVLVLLSPALPTTSVPANLLAAPAVVPATLLGLAATVTAPWWPFAAHALAWLAGCATWWIAAVARWCACLPGAAVPWPGGVLGATALGVLTVVGVALVLRRPPGEGWPHAWTDLARRRWRTAHASGRAALVRFRHGTPSRRDRRRALGAVLAALTAVVVVTTVAVRAVPHAGDVPADWQVVACDVGQGDGLVVRTGPAAAVVVDVGPDGDAADRCLDRLGVTRVDLLVLSHFHADHVGGLPAVLAGREVRAAWGSPLHEPAGQARRTVEALERVGVTVQVPAPGDAGVLGEGGWRVEWHVLGTGLVGGGSAGAGGTGTGGTGLGTTRTSSAGTGGSVEGDGVNDASLSLELVASGPGGTLDVVALGDLEQPGQDALLASLEAGGPPGVLDGVDVVKVAHHGSASQSPGLARLLRPRVALVSVGEGNTYGHPTDRMLDLYAGVGSTVVRTDECGSAVLVVRGGRTSLACVR